MGVFSDVLFEKIEMEMEETNWSISIVKSR